MSITMKVQINIPLLIGSQDLLVNFIIRNNLLINMGALIRAISNIRLTKEKIAIWGLALIALIFFSYPK